MNGIKIVMKWIGMELNGGNGENSTLEICMGITVLSKSEI